MKTLTDARYEHLLTDEACSMVPGLPDIDLSIQQCAHDLPEFPVRVVRVCRQAQPCNAATVRVVKPDPRHDERPRAPG